MREITAIELCKRLHGAIRVSGLAGVSQGSANKWNGIPDVQVIGAIINIF